VPPAVDPDRTTFRPSPARPGSSSRTEAGAGARSTKGARATQFDSEYREPLAPGPKWWERIFFGRVSSGQLAQFCRQFASYLNAGVDYTRTFSSLEKQFTGSALGPAVGRIRLAIKGGSTLEEAMAREPQIFSNMFLSMIRVAEARGGVPETLRMMGNHYEARQRLIRQARSAMIYPVIVLVMAGGVIALLTIVLLPMFASMLKDIDKRVQLPLPSRALLAFSSFVSWVGWWFIPLVLVGTPFLIYRFYKTSPGKALIDRLILRMPVLGSLYRKLDISRFARTLSTLLDAGVDVGSSIDLTAGVITMTPISQAVRAAREKVIQGKELSVALAPSGQFSPDVLAVLQTGEETGKVPESLSHLADDYEEQVSGMVKNLGHLVQPLVVMILGGVVLFILLAVFVPYVQILTGLSGP
jgi:type II secretory pathway component PulF